MLGRLTATAVLCGLACAEQPTRVVEAFDWEESIADLDEAILSVCGSDGVVYAVGGTSGRGMILEYRGGRFTSQSLPSSDLLWWCFAAGDDAIAVGESGTVLRRGAETWLRDSVPPEMQGATLYGVWGRDDGTIYAVGGSPNRPDLEPVAARRAKGSWKLLDTSELVGSVLFKVWGTGSADVWMVGTGGVIARVEGDAVVRVQSPTTADLIAVYGSRANDVYAVGGSGSGIVLRFDGSGWTEFATAPEELSAVWTAPGQPLYIGGDRGYMRRYPRRQSLIEEEPTTTVAASDLCTHALFGLEDFVVAAVSDLVGGTRDRWRGGVLSHRRVLGTGIIRPVPADAGTGVPGDAGSDAGGSEDLGQNCGVPPECDSALECWYLQLSGEPICTRECASDDDCSDFPGGACCERPGIQTLTTVCIPQDAAECTSPI